MIRARIGASATAMVAMLVLLVATSASADWMTYHGDAQRSGVDSSSSGSVPFTPAWTSPVLAGPIYGQALVRGGLVVVATESNDVYALRESTGQVVWHQHLATPVPASALPCGDISPSVGITSTPVIDPATNRVFVVADTWDGSNASSIRHLLFGFDLSGGSALSGLPLPVDPPASNHAALLQRTALALDSGKVIIGYGGNDGDCGTYHGWLVTAPETGGALQTFAVSPSGGGAIWGGGDGAAVDSSGNIWAATGNGFGSAYAHQESVLKLNPDLGLTDYWAPADWQYLDDNDIDLGSSEPLLLPGGLVFQIGKEGVGYLLATSSLGGTGGQAVYQAQVCGGGSFGGDAYYAGVIYVTCSDGLRALSLNTSTRRFTPLSGWQVQSTVNGPPIVAGGLVWAADYDSSPGELYGLDLHTGHAFVTQATPHMVHFTSPSASDGKLFLATGQTVEAYAIANGRSSSSIPPPPPSGPTCGCGRSRCRTLLTLIRARHGRITAVKVYRGRELLGKKHGYRLRRIWFTSPSHRTSFSVRVIEQTSRRRRLTFKVSYRNCHRIKAARHLTRG